MKDTTDSRDRRAVDALKRRLAEAADTMALTQRHLDAERKRRDLLCLKLMTAGCSTREIGAVAGLSSPGVLLATDRAAKDRADA